MITRRILANLVVFFAISMGLVAYGAVTLFGNPLEHRRTVVADLPDAAGLRKGFSASHDGVVVGTVSQIALRPGGVRVTVELDPGQTVPRGVAARVVRALAVGEQRLDLVSTSTSPGRPLPDGAKVPLAKDPVPPDVADVLASTNEFIRALPADDLNTLVHELALSVDGRANDLKAITRSLSTMDDDVVAVDPDLRKLLDDGPPVLDDFSAMSPEAHQALDNTEALTEILASRDDDLVRLFVDGGDLGTTADRVLRDDRASLTCLVADLRTINHSVQGQTLDDLDRSLDINQLFFGAIDRVAVRGEAKDVGYGPAQPNALWLRSRLLVPPAQPSAIRYSPPRAPRPVIPGKACTNRYGTGAEATPVATKAEAAAGRGASAADRTSPAIDRVGTSSRSGTADRSADPVEDPGSPYVLPLLILGIGTLLAVAAATPTPRSLRRKR